MRLPDWEQRLTAYLAEARKKPHAYGEHDCLLHCGAALEAVTGDDRVSEHRGQYHSQAGAVRYLRGLGFDSPEAMIDSILPEVPIGFAQRGDLVLTPGERWPVPAVCVGATAVCAGGGVEPRSRWLKAWRAG